MPIVLGSNTSPDFTSRLQQAGVSTLDPKHAQQQDIRPAKIGLFNLMPAAAMEATELQWLSRIATTPILQIEVFLIKFDNDRREDPDRSRSKLLKSYRPLSEIKDFGLDGLIVTGDNQEIKRNNKSFSSRLINPAELPLYELEYYDKLKELVRWADSNVSSTIYSCLGAHFALNCLYGLRRGIGAEKTFGVFNHDIINPGLFMEGMGDHATSPHSRWGNIPTRQIETQSDIDILALNERIGWLALQRVNSGGGHDLLLQGHPEYGKYDLQKEAGRDGVETYEGSSEGYCWPSDAGMLHANWINYVYNKYSME